MGSLDFRALAVGKEKSSTLDKAEALAAKGHQLKSFLRMISHQCCQNKEDLEGNIAISCGWNFSGGLLGFFDSIDELDSVPSKIFFGTSRCVVR
jgi:hypothetical protein